MLKTMFIALCGPDGIMDAMKAKMPWMHGKPLFIQHDGAKPHNGRGNLLYIEQQGQLDGWNIQIITQPAQSPDLNILDLGFFNSLKSRVAKLKVNASSLDDLMSRVYKAFEEYDSETLDSIWSQLFTNYNIISQEMGGNNSKVYHAGNRRKQRDKDSKCDLSIDKEVYNECVRHVNAYRNGNHFKLLR